MTTVFFYSDLDDPQAWRATLQAALPDLKFVTGPECDQPEAVDVALVWTPPPQGFRAFTNLRAVLSLGAGIDQLRLTDIDAHIPVARLIDPTLTQRMVEYCLAAVFYFHRHLHLHARHQAAREWRFLPPGNTSERRVLVLGLGELGAAVAQALAQLGFQVTGWSRSAKQITDVECRIGSAALAQSLGSCDVVINLLPLTAETSGLLNRNFFALLKPETCLIQVGRGGHLVEADLLAALDQGQVAGAFIDVFSVEPLPVDHPFWTHPYLRLTPHVASLSDPAQSSVTVIENIRRAMRGEPLQHAVDRTVGY
ncbi:D-isomer specific 2-hydroxyacid dehydrogenase NAD-binding [Acidovorax delafieldii 2AN]|uniref:D-isomer specific 2-hydroxyacid dehydrogenase NAD-binding n=1 Tax=Acidovorax delafieldii 2AN TaxID=573060 RepID=C5T0B4_ACIDE|nr:glyoxylate/hydroxypyruvate reductase A [Acidovorax delafieldii]EER62067.1 D-isomer specific 2-hydroxyacid dehydrogenase NAD-binding [Acidovorax delafieldii 2AN]